MDAEADWCLRWMHISNGTFSDVAAHLIVHIQSTRAISNSEGLTETLRDIRTSTYQSCESEENNELNNHILQMNM